MLEHDLSQEELDLFLKPPEVIILELTNHCNLKCPLCATNIAMKRERGFMVISLFEKLIQELVENNIFPLISINMCGEPLLHDHVVLFVKEAYKNGFSTYISTNVTQLNADLAGRLIDSGLSTIALCVDGATAFAHESYRKGSDYQKIINNCETFLKIRNNSTANKPRVIIQTLLTVFSEPEMEKIVDWAWIIGADEVHFKSLSLGSHTTEQQRKANAYLLPNNPVLHRNRSPQKQSCMNPVKHTIIYWNGDMGICCVDFNNMADMPNITNKSFIDTFYSKAMLNHRIKGYIRQHLLCKSCQSARLGNHGFRILFDELRSAKRYSSSIPLWSRMIKDELQKSAAL